MMPAIYVFLGSGIGGLMRYILNENLKHIHGFPWATLLSNFFASFILGVYLGFSRDSNIVSQNYKYFIAIGVCGGFSTFSTFTFDNWQYLSNSNFMLFFINSIANIVFCLIAITIGITLYSKLSN